MSQRAARQPCCAAAHFELWPANVRADCHLTFITRLRPPQSQKWEALADTPGAERGQVALLKTQRAHDVVLVGQCALFSPFILQRC